MLPGLACRSANQQHGKYRRMVSHTLVNFRRQDFSTAMKVQCVVFLAASVVGAIRYIDTTPATPTVAVNWTPYRPKYAPGLLEKPHVTGMSQAFVAVPQDYFGEHDTEGKTLRMRVRRIERGAPERHMWFIPGGPGEHSNTIEVLAELITDILPQNTWIYSLDHRGRGKSGKIASSKKQVQCLYNFSKCVQELPFPVKILSIHNAAMDFITITRSLKVQGQSWFLLGTSYGGMLVDYILRFAPDLFEGALANSMHPHFYVGEYLPYSLNKNFVESCQSSVACRSLLDPTTFNGSLESFGRSNNQCIRALLFGLKNPVGTIGQLALSSIQRYAGGPDSFFILLYLVMVNRLANGELFYSLISLIKLGSDCSNVVAFSRLFNTIMHYIPKESVRRFDRKLQMALSPYIVRSESLYDIKRCSQDRMSILEDNCMRFVLLLDLIPEKFLYKPLYPTDKPFNTRLIYASSRLDVRTLHDVAEAHFNKATAKEKLFLSINSSNHHGILLTECAKPTYEYLLLGTQSREARQSRACETFGQTTKDGHKLQSYRPPFSNEKLRSTT